MADRGELTSIDDGEPPARTAAAKKTDTADEWTAALHRSAAATVCRADRTGPSRDLLPDLVVAGPTFPSTSGPTIAPGHRGRPVLVDSFPHPHLLHCVWVC